MAFENPSREEIAHILRNAGNIAVVGLSDRPERTSHMVAAAMKERGYRIIPVNPSVSEVLGEKSYPSLKDISEPIDIVNVFRRSEYCADIAQEAVEIGAKVLWLQQGIISEDAHAIAHEHGLTVIMDRCIKVEDAIALAGGKS